MRINTDGRYHWRTDLYDRVGELLDERTKAGAIDSACKFIEQMIPNLERAIEHPDMTEEIAELLLSKMQ